MTWRVRSVAACCSRDATVEAEKLVRAARAADKRPMKVEDLFALKRAAAPQVSPDGKTVTQYKLPDPMVTNVCFGGKDLRTAYATLSMTGKLVSFEWPRPGLQLNF